MIRPVVVWAGSGLLEGGFACVQAASGKSRRLLIQVLLESCEQLADVIGFAKVDLGVGDRVVILELKQWPELVRVQFLDANGHVVLKHKVQERLLLGAEFRADLTPRALGSYLAGAWRHRVGNVGQDIEQVALFCIDDLLHLGQLLVAKALVGESF